MVSGNHAVAAVLILALIVAFVVLLVNDKPKWAAGTGATLVLVGLGAAYTQRAAIVRMFGGGVAVLGGGGKNSPVNAWLRDKYGNKWYETNKAARQGEARAALGMGQKSKRKHSAAPSEAKRINAHARATYGNKWYETNKAARQAEARAELGIEARRGKPVAPESDGESDISLSSEEDGESDVSLTSDDDDDRPLKFRRTTHQKRW